MPNNQWLIAATEGDKPRDGRSLAEFGIPMILEVVASAVLAMAVVEDTPAASRLARLGWVQEAKSHLPSVRASDRPVAYRNYADMLVDVGDCDEAVRVLKSDAIFDAELIESTMTHASWLGDRQCAAALGKLAESRIGLTTNPLKRAELLMLAGATMRAGGDEAHGAKVVFDAENLLKAEASTGPTGKASASEQTLWMARRWILSTYAGTPLFAPALTQYGQELATNLARSKTYLSLPDLRGFVRWFAVNGRTDLINLVANETEPSDRIDLLKTAGIPSNPDVDYLLADKPAPHCPGSLDTEETRPFLLNERGPFETIVNLALRSGIAARDQRCLATSG